MRALAPVVLVALSLAACSRNGLAHDAVDTCVTAVRAGGDEPDSTLAGRNVATACAPLFAEPACREGFATAWAESTSPAERTRILVDACTAAYCPKLDAPKPDLCVAPAEDFVTRARQWQSFQKVVLTRDLGAPRAERVLAEMAAAGEKRSKSSAGLPDAR
jgi:hypothetical protein